MTKGVVRMRTVRRIGMAETEVGVLLDMLRVIAVPLSLAQEPTYERCSDRPFASA